MGVNVWWETNKGHSYDKTKLYKEVELVKEYIDEFGSDFPVGVSLDKFNNELPEIMKVILSYLRYVDVDVSDKTYVERLWSNNELVDWEDDWPFILQFANNIIAKGKGSWHSLFCRYYKEKELLV